jgi:hypothetical protein
MPFNAVCQGHRHQRPYPAQDRRKTEGPALALLRIAARHPNIVRENLVSAAQDKRDDSLSRAFTQASMAKWGHAASAFAALTVVGPDTIRGFEPRRPVEGRSWRRRFWRSPDHSERAPERGWSVWRISRRCQGRPRCRPLPDGPQAPAQPLLSRTRVPSFGRDRTTPPRNRREPAGRFSQCDGRNGARSGARDARRRADGGIFRTSRLLGPAPRVCDLPHRSRGRRCDVLWTGGTPLQETNHHQCVHQTDPVKTSFSFRRLNSPKDAELCRMHRCETFRPRMKSLAGFRPPISRRSEGIAHDVYCALDASARTTSRTSTSRSIAAFFTMISISIQALAGNRTQRRFRCHRQSRSHQCP